MLQILNLHECLFSLFFYFYSHCLNIYTELLRFFHIPLLYAHICFKFLFLSIHKIFPLLLPPPHFKIKKLLSLLILVANHSIVILIIFVLFDWSFVTCYSSFQ